jgi:hypothetical protein
VIGLIIYATTSMALAPGTKTPSQDLALMYPSAQREVVDYLACRATYITDHAKETAPAESINQRSSELCFSAEHALFDKIRAVNGDPITLKGRVDAALLRKIAQLRAGGIPTNPSVEWAACIKRNIALPATKADIDHALSDAYRACSKEEGVLAEYIRRGAGSAEVAHALGMAKSGIKSSLVRAYEAKGVQ